MPAMKNKKPLFIFNVLSSKSELKRDEVSVVSKILCAGICLLLIFNLAVIIFYFQTNARIQILNDDEFTKTVYNSLEESKITHESFSTKARGFIQNKNVNIKQYVDKLNADNKKLNTLDPKHITINGLGKLQDTIKDLESDIKPSYEKIEKAKKIFLEVEEQIKALNNYLMPIKYYEDDQMLIEQSLMPVLNDIKANLDHFGLQLDSLAKRQNTNQMKLYNEMAGALTEFQKVYNFVYKKAPKPDNDKNKQNNDESPNDNDYVVINNYYKVDFLRFDKQHVPFSIEFERKYSGAQLSIEKNFDLRLPRVYACTIQAYIYSPHLFDIAFQYVDRKDNSENQAEDDADVLFKVSGIRGEYGNPASISEMKIFELPAGKHNLYLRVVSTGAARRIHMEKLAMSCLSYRNFQEVGKPNSEF